MEELLKLLMKDAQAAKFAPIRQSCKAAIGKFYKDIHAFINPLLKKVGFNYLICFAHVGRWS